MTIQDRKHDQEQSPRPGMKIQDRNKTRNEDSRLGPTGTKFQDRGQDRERRFKTGTNGNEVSRPETRPGTKIQDWDQRERSFKTGDKTGNEDSRSGPTG